MRRHRVRVEELPAWLDARRLLGPGDWSLRDGVAEAELTGDAAADLAARLRGVGLGGAKLRVTVFPGLERRLIRQARTRDARRRRRTSVGLSKAGVQTDEEGRVSLTPEQLALALGERAQAALVIDAGCGVGGNSIGFARAGCRVIAVDTNPARLKMARHNARLYGVSDRIEFIDARAEQVAQRRDADLLFVDPPWGVDWNRERTDIADVPMLSALLESRARFDRMWAKLPPSFDPGDLPHRRISAVFGVESGDERRVKFLLLEF